MADLADREVYAMSRIEARLRLVITYHETGSISETARRAFNAVHRALATGQSPKV